MPLRVVTIDAGGALASVGLDLISGAAFQPYRNPATDEMLLRGFMVGFLTGEYGNMHEANGNVYEYLDDMPTRLKTADGDALHQIAGVPWPQTPPVGPPSGMRTAMCAVELEPVLGVPVYAFNAFWLGDGDRLILEAVINSPSDDATGIHNRMWDAIEDHPAPLQTRLERLARVGTRQARRQTASDPAPAWGETNG
jgi:hypothetical protein